MPEGTAIVESLVADHLLCSTTVQRPNNNPVLAHMMIDSGSQSSLVSEEFVLKHQLTSTPLRPMIPIQGLDGKPLLKGSISHVATFNIRIGDHTEVKTFGIVKMPWDLLLGVDWLQTHNPVINWKSSSICFSCCDSGCLGAQFTTLASATLAPGSLDSESINIAILSAHDLFQTDDILHMGILCLSPDFSSICVTSLNPVGPPLISANPEGNPSQLSHKSIAAKVPAKYHEFLDLFVDKEATKLSPHCTHDINIELELGKNPPFGLIYTLTDKEKEVLQTYLAENLAKGFIHPSTSSTASPILFVKKGNRSL